MLATGYGAEVPDFLEPIRDRLDWDARGRLDVAREYTVDGDRGRVFVLNGEEHSHGVTAPDLGFGAWRNAVIIAAITGREVYPIERRIAFQEFGVPADALPVPGAAASSTAASSVDAASAAAASASADAVEADAVEVAR
ncbi:hypothetical protein GCM10027515_05340 [Schumannella luteola]|uniref:L-lysine N6-monooxygenase MbtG n=1 Tax=Schumannella luteola TaxID=472059 RepID=A0A852YAV7_9MICO|nr:lysine/ornithine N-monooxygenase [Schumannella luteola]